MATPMSHEEERQAYAEFASLHAEDDYRTRLAELYASWRDFNDRFFEVRLLEPHLTIGRTAPRSLGHCAKTTDYGGKVAVTLNAGLVFGTNRDWVIHRWPPAEGTRRFIENLLLRLTVRQFISEVSGDDEPGYRGFGPKFVRHANRIGKELWLRPVVERRRGAGDREPVARGWPHCVRPADYYGDDVTERALDLARGSARRLGVAPPTASQGLLEFLLFLLNAGRTGDARLLVARHLEWVRGLRESRWPTRRRVEAGRQDVDGSPLGVVTLSPEWLKWNDGTVARIAQGVHQFGNYGDLPILADALEEAGCEDGRILRHLRAPMEHSRRCWVLRLLLALEGE
jgi:hypothetical protein